MSSSTSVAVVFRTLQSINDLRSLARRSTDDTLARIAAGMSVPSAKARLHRLIFTDGCRLTGADAESVHLSLLLAATLPDDDFEAFVTATSILISDRLQHGEGTDDLYWHWDAFHAHYQIAAPEARAVLLHGFLRLHEDGRVILPDPPAGAGLVSQTTEHVLAAAGRAGDKRLARELENSLRSGAFQNVERMWFEGWKTFRGLNDQDAFAVFRHAYEAHRDWNPFPEARYQVAETDAPTIPFQPR